MAYRIWILVLIVTTFIPFAESRAARVTVIIKNNSPQVLTSAVCAVHNEGTSIYTLGEEASEGLVGLAEDGVEGDYAGELRALPGVRMVRIGQFINAGETGRVSLRVRRGEEISCVLGMLVATNDGFSAFQNRPAPTSRRRRSGFFARVYDAGSELNSESCDHIPGGPCDAHFVGEAENGTIQAHPGISGRADLSNEQHGWDERSVRVVLLRQGRR